MSERALERVSRALPPTSDASPPSTGFCLFAAAVPAAPFCLYLPASLLLFSLPVWVFIFYLPLPLTSYKTFAACTLATYYGLTVLEGWMSWWKIAAGTFFLAQCMNLSLSALWDAAEPFLIGSPNFGSGKQLVRHPPKRRVILDKDGKPLGPQTVLLPGTELLVDGKPYIVPGERVTAATSIAAGDPTRAAAAAAFTQNELDALAMMGVKPWDPVARDALEKLFRAEALAERARSDVGVFRRA